MGDDLSRPTPPRVTEGGPQPEGRGGKDGQEMGWCDKGWGKRWVQELVMGKEDWGKSELRERERENPFSLPWGVTDQGGVKGGL